MACAPAKRRHGAAATAALQYTPIQSSLRTGVHGPCTAAALTRRGVARCIHSHSQLEPGCFDHVRVVLRSSHRRQRQVAWHARVGLRCGCCARCAAQPDEAVTGQHNVAALRGWSQRMAGERVRTGQPDEAKCSPNWYLEQAVYEGNASTYPPWRRVGHSVSI